MDKVLDDFEAMLYRCEKPSQYIGGEFLSFKKDFNASDVKFLLAFPDKYEIGISNFGHKILYHVINSRENFLADRLYAPELDFKKMAQEKKFLLRGFDTKKNARDFDFIGFSLQYELSYTTVLAMLEMSGIPVLAKERTKDYPIILAGGPCTFNPNPMWDFIDLFLIGDGEETIIEICEKYNQIKEKPKEEIIKELSLIEGVFAPQYPREVKKRNSELKYENHPVKSPIPHFASVHDRATVEIRRGCSRLCRFCQSAHTNLPIRERTKEDIISLVREYVKNTGYDEYSLLSLASNDHKDIIEILKELNALYKDTGITVSLPSQRADNFSIELANLMGEVKKSTVTLAPEAGTQRMRDIIKKGLTEEQIIKAVLACCENGWQKIKFYFMIGLPRESYEDIEGIAILLSKINQIIKEKKLRLPNITCSVSIFVPKPFTPFQWCRMNSLDEIQEKAKFLKEKAKHLKNVKINVHTSKMSVLETFLTRGDRSLGDFIYKLHKKGAYLESWEENINWEAYKEISKELDINIENTACMAFNIEDNLPWDFINCGLDKSYFANEFTSAFSV